MKTLEFTAAIMECQHVYMAQETGSLLLSAKPDFFFRIVNFYICTFDDDRCVCVNVCLCICQCAIHSPFNKWHIKKIYQNL